MDLNIVKLWNSLSGNSTKTIFVVGVISLMSQLITMWPLEVTDVVQLAFSAAIVAFSVYTVQCLNVGNCTKFAWVTVLLPFIVYSLIIFLTMISGKTVMIDGNVPRDGSFGHYNLPRKNYSCDVPLEQKGDATKMYEPVSSSSQTDFYNKNQFRDYYVPDSHFRDS